ncbi:MAG: hypothetical protein FD126_277 [Elusimicrobia bacterium]|nr:MAG: hypothetical protein FD126_277 [Elusimicrobiota bacterium]
MPPLKPRLLPLLRQHYPEARYDGSDPKLIVTFAGPPEVGDLQVWDDGDEATMAIGKLTHVHITAYESLPYDPNISEEEIAKRVTEEVLKFLEGFFAERIVVWTETAKKIASVGSIEAMPVPLPEGDEAFSWKGRLHPKAG